MIRLLIIGTRRLADRLIDAIETGPPRRYRMLGLIGELSPASVLDPACPTLGTVADLDRLVTQLSPDVIAVAFGDRRGALPLRELLEYRVSRGITVEDGAELCERLTGAVSVDALTPSSLIFAGPLAMSRFTLFCTRAIGVAIALVALIVCSPVLLLIALAIALDSKGPIIFAQPRVGLGGRPFTLLKFRTMSESALRASEWVSDNDDRITRVGRWLRKYRLDELPQFVNVLRGDMNLVGPRPHPVSNIEVLRLLTRNLSDVTGLDIPCYTLRTLVRPGITGWAQVRYGYANNFDEEIEKLRYDLYYVKHLSIWLDLRILVETIGVVLRGHDSGPMATRKPRRSTT